MHLLVTDLREGPDNSKAIDALGNEFPELGHIDLIDESADTVPFFGPWRVSGSRMTLRKPIRIDDLILAVRTLAALP